MTYFKFLVTYFFPLPRRFEGILPESRTQRLLRPAPGTRLGAQAQFPRTLSGKKGKKKTSRLKRTGRVASSNTEREGLEPPSPFGRSLSRRVHYHSASAPERLRPDNARWASAGALTFRNVNNDGTSSVGAPGFEPGTSASRTQRSTGLSHAPKHEQKGRLSLAPERHGQGGIRTHETVFAAHTLSRRAP
jgi:hypothetical protein